MYIKSDHAILGLVAQPRKNVVLHSWDTWLAFVERPELLIEEIINSHFELTNPTILEFEESYTLVVPIIASHARSNGELRALSSRPMKLSPQQLSLNLHLYMKHDNVSSYNAFVWNA